MTDTTTVKSDEKPAEQPPCEKCDSTKHTTQGHFEGNGVPENEDDGITVSPQGHFEGNSIPTGGTA